jgi:glycosyltransferase involved in cell wall biosynthesis
VSHIAFFSYTPVVGGVSAYQAGQIRFLLPRTRVSLLDETPHTTLSHLPTAEATHPHTVHLPLWTQRRRAAGMLQDWLDQEQPSVVALSNPGLLLLYRSELRSAQRRHGTRVLLTQHSGVLTMTPRRWVMEVMTSLSGTAVDDTVYVSEYTRRYWTRKYPWLRRLPSRVVPNGVELPDLPMLPRRLGPTVRVGFVGRLEDEKGIGLFCEVAEAFKDPHRMEFHIFGEGSRGAELRRRYPGFRWRGHVSDPAVIFSGLDLLLMTSPVENSPFAVLEAKSHAVPTVSARVGGLPEVVRHGVDGVLAPVRDVPGLVRALGEAVASYEQLSGHCIHTRETFDIRRTAAATWGSYLEGAACASSI